MSNSCKMPLKAYMQCVRASQCFITNPTDMNMAACSREEEVQDQCKVFYTNYQQCKMELMNATSRMRGNRTLRD